MEEYLPDGRKVGLRGPFNDAKLEWYMTLPLVAAADNMEKKIGDGKGIWGRGVRAEEEEMVCRACPTRLAEA